MPTAGYRPDFSDLWEDYGAQKLSRREKQVLHLAALGLTKGEAAEILNLSEETVKTHGKKLLTKLCARNMPHAITIAWTEGELTTHSLILTKNHFPQLKQMLKNASLGRPVKL